MRCDKCGKRFIDKWIISEYWPKYQITERTEILGEGSSVFLCDICSRRFKNWLDETPEVEDETDRRGCADERIRERNGTC